MPKAIGSRGWWREYFKDHPRLNSNDPNAYATGKPKVMCLRHIDRDIASVIAEEKAEVEGNRRIVVRSAEQIEDECESFSIDYMY